MWVASQDLPRGAAHPFYTRLNQILDQHDFEGTSRDSASDSTPMTAGQACRQALLPVAADRVLRGLDAERAIAWRAADSFALRQFLGLVLPEARTSAGTPTSASGC